MLMIALGILIAVILLIGFGFISTASAGWFFTIPKKRKIPSPTRQEQLISREPDRDGVTVPGSGHAAASLQRVPQGRAVHRLRL
jgi:uncharacterized SAM-binding protein YcdF (DUF218 family)